eukprot:c46379_g1_i1.p1 GENE.c46379_g1_i1~~c46379_g1_i1.p1  ORF type:complete len:280 (+),score=34.01 c46379_g1_i1:2-841(+)
MGYQMRLWVLVACVLAHPLAPAGTRHIDEIAGQDPFLICVSEKCGAPISFLEADGCTDGDSTLSSPKPTAIKPIFRNITSGRPILELFVMSKCPSAAEAESNILQALQSFQTRAHVQDPFDLKLQFIGHVVMNNKTGHLALTSMHGREEVLGDMWEWCVADAISPSAPAALMQFLTCVNRNRADIPNTDHFKKCSSSIPHLKFSDIQHCIDSGRAGHSLAESFRRSREVEVHTSPTLVLNGEVLQHRDPRTLVAALCRALPAKEAITLSVCARHSSSVS